MSLLNVRFRDGLVRFEDPPARTPDCHCKARQSWQALSVSVELKIEMPLLAYLFGHLLDRSHQCSFCSPRYLGQQSTPLLEKQWHLQIVEDRVSIPVDRSNKAIAGTLWCCKKRCKVFVGPSTRSSGSPASFSSMAVYSRFTRFARSRSDR